MRAAELKFTLELAHITSRERRSERGIMNHRGPIRRTGNALPHGERGHYKCVMFSHKVPEILLLLALPGPSYRLPDLLWLQRHVQVPNAEGTKCIDHGIHDSRRGSDGASLADPFDAQGVDWGGCDCVVRLEVGQVFSSWEGIVHQGTGQQLSLLVVLRALEERLPYALGESTMDLSGGQQGVDDVAAII